MALKSTGLLMILIITAGILVLPGCGNKYEGLHSFSSFNYPDQHIRHRNGEGWISQLSSDNDKKDATFHILPGLSDGTGFSFESSNYPGMYLRHQNGKIFLHAIAMDDAQGKADATFTIVPGLADSSKVSFESVNYPGMYIRHSSQRLLLSALEENEIFKADATFALSRPVDAGQ